MIVIARLDKMPGAPGILSGFFVGKTFFVRAHIQSIPAIVANSTEAQLVHEAAIGKIAGDQLLKLETLGLTPEEAEECILKGFLA